MSVFFETLLAVLAGAGALAIGWVIFGRMVTPVGSARYDNVCAVIRAEGSGATLQHAVDGLLWLNQSGFSAFRIVIADAGLDDEGRRIASSLAAHRAQVAVCPLAALGDWIAANRW